MQKKTRAEGRGGVLICIRANLNYKIRNDLTFSNFDNELLTIEIINENTKNLIVTCCYRPPSGNQNTINSFDKVWENGLSINLNLWGCLEDSSFNQSNF